jgi:hypothetical protein
MNSREVERLAGCLPKLDAIYDAVKATGLGGKASLMQQCQEVFDTIHALLVAEAAANARTRETIAARAAERSDQESAGRGVGAGSDQAGPGAQEES